MQSTTVDVLAVQDVARPDFNIAFVLHQQSLKIPIKIMTIFTYRHFLPTLAASGNICVDSQK